MSEKEEKETQKEFYDRILKTIKYRLLVPEDFKRKKKNPYKIKWDEK